MKRLMVSLLVLANQGDPMLIDVYVLASERSSKYAYRFLDTWTKGFEQAADEYEYPQYATKPDIVLTEPKSLIERLIEDPTQPYSIYWSNLHDDLISSAMLFFTVDGGMIVGVSVAIDDLSKAAPYLRSLADDFDGRLGYATFEEPPPDSTEDFIKTVTLSAGPKILQG
jgi:hypothetical protein